MGVVGVEARAERVVEVRTGVRWMWGVMRAWAERTESRVSGRVDGVGVGAGAGAASVDMVRYVSVFLCLFGERWG